MTRALTVIPASSARRRFGIALVAVFLVFLVVPPAQASHVGCGDVLTSDTTLDSDLNCAGTALIIGAPGIILDLGGNTISGDGTGRGLNNLGHDFVTIRNGTIVNFEAGVWFSGGGVTDSEVTSLTLSGNGHGVFLNAGSHGNELHHNTVIDTSVSGIALNGSDNNLIEKNEFTGSSFAGVELFAGSAHNTVSKNDIVGGGSGVYQSVTNNNYVVKNSITNPGASGIVLFDANDGVVSKNSVTGATSHGISSSGSDNNLIVGNTVKGGDLGFVLIDSSGNTFKKNTANGNDQGFTLEDSSDNTFEKNTANDNFFDGFFLDESSDNAFEKNTADDNFTNGFSISGFSLNNTFKKNAANGNGDFDAVQDGTSTGNVFEGNDFSTTSGI